MITVIKQPPQAVLVNNDVNYTLQTNNFLVTLGVKAEIVLVITALSNTGVLTFTFMGKTYTFAPTSGTDNYSGLQFHNGTGFSVYSNYGTEFVNWLRKNYDLETNYDISRFNSTGSSVSIRILAKKEGALYNITATSNMAGITPGTPTAGTSTVYRERFNVLADLYIQTNFSLASPVFELAFAGNAIPDSNNQVIFNFTDVLKSLLYFDIPIFDDLQPYLNKSVRNFYIKYAESYGFPTTNAGYYACSQRMSFLGGQKFVNTAADIFYSTYIQPAVKKFLTNMPNFTKVTKAQKQYLSFYTENDVIKSALTLAYTDNTSQNFETNVDLGGTGVYTFAVGYYDLDIDAIKASGKTVRAYSITYKDGTTAITETKTFEVDLNTQLFARSFLFFNSFGMPESILTTGKQNKSGDFKNELVRKASLQFNNTTGEMAGEFDTLNTQVQYTYEANTGFKTKEWVEYFTDFMLSKQKYLQADKWIGIQVPAQKINILEDDNYLYALKFTYSDNFIEKGNI